MNSLLFFCHFLPISFPIICQSSCLSITPCWFARGDTYASGDSLAWKEKKNNKQTDKTGILHSFKCHPSCQLCCYPARWTKRVNLMLTLIIFPWPQKLFIFSSPFFHNFFTYPYPHTCEAGLVSTNKGFNDPFSESPKKQACHSLFFCYLLAY